MGDRYDRRSFAPQVEMLLRRPGIGHNGGPTFDMSWEAWTWRRAVAKAWKPPKPEVALRRLAKAEKLGITYREFTAVILETGTHLSTAILPLGLVARVRQVGHDRLVAEARPEMAAKVGRFGGRLFLLADRLLHGDLDTAAREAMRSDLNRALDAKVEAIVIAGPSTSNRRDPRAEAMLAMLRSHGVPKQEVFFVGTGFADVALAEATTLPLFKWAHEWFGEASGDGS
jgi:phosphoglycolate phosphatase-like HAD superfamily hydrolase